ncbi:N-acetylmuramoyl-L-alanine amidase [Clostridium tepidiprofundi DSM 19306]|uniref:N-acetylmuramoyl-L-alanine amidase n=1 Tax=Clostridium tepidiprofundi DSM 19306 TaxID=1121338 RepID=A0A151B7B0_9CLOT|nr:peptidoglycan recognition family protein [Clostridium tepidiprofundi]KYH35818.1 N-acetylmuramoyl-L-alanine amidase [Clostridium tepidiprofundi DSM 19306]
MKIIESNLKFKSKLSKRVKTNLIVLHHAVASHCTIQDIHRWHLNRGWSGCGYHFLVRKDGSIYRGRPENVIGAHCLHHNNYSIGICAEGSYMQEVMPQIQKKAIIELCKYLMYKYNIKDIKGHRELYNTSCPGDNFPFNEIVQAALKPKYNANFCLLFQKWYNTLTKHKLAEDGIYGPKTEKAYESIKNILEDFSFRGF